MRPGLWHKTTRTLQQTPPRSCGIAFSSSSIASGFPRLSLQDVREASFHFAPQWDHDRRLRERVPEKLRCGVRFRVQHERWAWHGATNYLYDTSLGRFYESAGLLTGSLVQKPSDMVWQRIETFESRGCSGLSPSRETQGTEWGLKRASFWQRRVRNSTGLCLVDEGSDGTENESDANNHF
ncbi:hypothetical protein OG21DRAFT_1544733 [Imleria badia]|nr:hypothetical protein OG21DRAFT_1544733 [Imleria badia]